ncbi:period circadian protein homolog 3 isoform X2 [Rana temporaria]|uniref:period circadian protein homolog 3 isoform X2 n=1 Tax=Rana temporaria TaxID=8407 RepID=UPI001AAD57A8|nr:period circadian protein homolog 3 isoform X2 [Rana temporaria]
MSTEPQVEALIQNNEDWSTATGTEEESSPGKTSSCETPEEHHVDVEMHSSGSTGIDSGGNYCNGHESSGTDSHGNGPRITNCSFRMPSKSTGSSNNSEQMERTRSHKELMSMVQEMKRRLPSEKLNRNKPSTVDALNYALKCVRQVQANSAFFQVLTESGTARMGTTVHTIEDLETITSEHPPKNTDTFVIVFSLTSGKMVYISEQAAYTLNCKKKLLDSSRFVELLAPQDVSVFYKHTTQSHLLPWNIGTDSASLYEYTQVKSFFCRIRGGKDRDNEPQYNPYRMTPYSVRVRTSPDVEPEHCCIALVERIHSGYEAPRIPLDKRIFTTTHTPGCVFLEVDDRAVPLLGYLPQDLVGTSMLMYLHPEDRLLMLAMHRKILKYAGQPPFEHCPIRFCTQNGDYITLDTSWSSFVNPWSRKVAFIIGRHKVRTGPLNEDVFAARSTEVINFDKEIKELQGQIYKVLLQPVHNNGSSGYGSLGSNGSYEHYISIASSSDSNGNCVDESHKEPMTLKQVCTDITHLKDLGQQVYIDTRSKCVPKKREIFDKDAQKAKLNLNACVAPRGNMEGPAASSCEASRKGQHIPSYQQINCVDSIIRYLESYNIPALKRKCESSTNTTSSSSEDGKQGLSGQNDLEVLEDVPELAAPTSQLSAESMVTTDAQTTAAVVGAPLTDLTLSIKAMSVVSVTSQCSYSSTIVHVPQPESEDRAKHHSSKLSWKIPGNTEVTAIEDATGGSEQIEMRSSQAAGSTVTPEEFRQVGLTKEVLSAHTQKEEQNYVVQFRQRILQSPYSSYLQQDSRSKACSHERGEHSSPQTSPAAWKKGKKQGKHKRQKPMESSDSNGSHPNLPPRPRRSGPLPQSWSPSEVSYPSPSNMAFPPPMMIPIQPAFSMPGFPQMTTTVAGDCTNSSVTPESIPQSNISYNMQTFPGFPTPYMGTLMAVFLPNYNMYPTMNPQMNPTMNPQMNPTMNPQMNPTMNPQMNPTMNPQMNPTMNPQMNPTMNPQMPQPFFPSQYPCPPAYPYTGMPSAPQNFPSQIPTDFVDPTSRASSPMSAEGQQEAQIEDPHLFSHSRSSSPLQLVLLQEELPKPAEPQEGANAENQSDIKCTDAAEDSGNNDSHSASSELFDLLLQEDSQSGTGSAASASGSANSSSLGIGSNGSTSNRTSGSGVGSSNSSKYFASKSSASKSSDTSKKGHKRQEATESESFPKAAAAADSIWTVIERTPSPIMMTYQVPERDRETLLKEDLEKLTAMRSKQPWFTEEQKEELAEVHSWIRTRTIPQEIDTKTASAVVKMCPLLSFIQTGDTLIQEVCHRPDHQVNTEEKKSLIKGN